MAFSFNRNNCVINSLFMSRRKASLEGECSCFTKVSDSLKVDLSGGALANLHIEQTEAV